ncbi:MAG: hypothetical protein K0Q82_80 [Chryseobacterium indoltheticum]|jgi:hypothetical protein|nr:hypothetical protein [Chryseobacterium indoltheticum]
MISEEVQGNLPQPISGKKESVILRLEKKQSVSPLRKVSRL